MNNQTTHALELLLQHLAEQIANRTAHLLREQTQPDHRSPWLSVDAAAAYLDWPKQRLYKLTARNIVPHYRHERRLLFHRAELDRWLQPYAHGDRPTN
jgi:excisionase family DNA binding protein